MSVVGAWMYRVDQKMGVASTKSETTCDIHGRRANATATGGIGEESPIPSSIK